MSPPGLHEDLVVTEYITHQTFSLNDFHLYKPALLYNFLIHDHKGRLVFFTILRFAA